MGRGYRPRRQCPARAAALMLRAAALGAGHVFTENGTAGSTTGTVPRGDDATASSQSWPEARIEESKVRRRSWTTALRRPCTRPPPSSGSWQASIQRTMLSPAAP
jgi:hypothetical protein